MLPATFLLLFRVLFRFFYVYLTLHNSFGSGQGGRRTAGSFPTGSQTVRPSAGGLFL